MNALELTSLITAVSNSIASQVSEDELDLLAAVFTQIGDTLATISLQRGLESKK